jgi:hypothetical protein
MYNNLCYNTNFIFSIAIGNIAVYDLDLVSLGNIYIDGVSSIYADDTNLYLATTNSGILYSPVASISGSIFNDILVYKQIPDITSNHTKYIHGAGDYILVTTESGIDQYNKSSLARIYNESSKESSKCFQTSSGRFYYVSNAITETFFNQGLYKSTIVLTEQISVPGYQLKIILTPSNFEYSKASSDGRDLLFFDSNQEELPFYIESWVVDDTSIIWVKINTVGIRSLYIVYGDTTALSKSNPSSVFDLYDDFNYPVTVAGPNLFLPTYGNITVSGTPVDQVGLLYDGSTSGYYSYSFPNPGDYIQIEFFIPRVIRQCQLWQSSYSTVNDLFIYASNTGAFLGEEALLFVKTSSLSSFETVLFSTTTAYTYYRIVRGPGTSAWQVTEIKLFEMVWEPITTASGSPWVYSSNVGKFIITSSSILTCNSSSNDYIITDYNLEPPLIVEQRIKLNSGAEGKIAYSNVLEPTSDGLMWFPSGTPTFTPMFGGVLGSPYYNPSQAITTSWGILSIYFIPGSIKAFFEGTASFSKYWVGATSIGGDMALKLFGGDFESNVSIDWVRVRKYDPYAPTVLGISYSKTLEQQYELNVVYDNSVNWDDSSVGYTYPVEDGILINDIFITESTSTYSATDNVIFIATTDGLVVLEERRGDEQNSRIKYYKAKGY